MDFPVDITLRKTRMKFELTFKVVLLFSYQGFVCSFFEAILFSSSVFSEEVVLLCRATFISYHTCFILSRTFFIYLKIFFPISFKSMCSHVQRMLSYHRVCVTSSVFFTFLFFILELSFMYSRNLSSLLSHI